MSFKLVYNECVWPQKEEERMSVFLKSTWHANMVYIYSSYARGANFLIPTDVSYDMAIHMAIHIKLQVIHSNLVVFFMFSNFI